MVNRIVPWEFDGKRYFLAYTGRAMFEIGALTGSLLSFAEKLTPDGEGAEFILRAAEIMIDAAEAQRQYLGYAPGNRLDIDYLAAFAPPSAMLSLRGAVIEAYNKGLTREELLENEDVDLGLIELQKKAAED